MLAKLKIPDLKRMDAGKRDAVLLTWSFVLMASCVTLFVILIRQPNPHVDPHKPAPRRVGQTRPGRTAAGN